MHDYGFTLEDIASVVLQDRRNADGNPKAFFYQKGVPTMEEVVHAPVSGLTADQVDDVPFRGTERRRR